ncbi:MAG: DNA repair protein RecN [Phycisphaerae bacterium]|nr:DNA repair protein RecN [Phycisphaerae bacterium]
MLRELHISNLAIIEKVSLEFSAGLNVFTGQTGAGKSLIAGALELLLGLRGGGESAAMLVRPGCDEARVSGVFEIHHPELLQRLAETLDQPLSPGEPLLVTRRISSAGRSGVSVNGAPATMGMLRKAGELLVDIHSQHDQQFLLSSANQLTILDAFAGATDTRRRFGEILRELREHQRRLRELQTNEARRREMLDLYRHQADEIDQADLAPGQYEQAKQRYGMLKNVAQLQSLSAEVLQGLSESDGAVLEQLGVLRQGLRELVRMDASLADLSDAMHQADELLQDAARGLERYQDRLEADPGELERTEARLDVLNRLIHKYARDAAGEDPISAVLVHRETIGKALEELDSDGQSIETLQRRIGQRQADLAKVGEKLSRLRRRAAGRLAPLVEEQFRELEMPEAAFRAELRTRAVDAPDVDASGLEEMEFLVRTNPGQELLPLRKIASGGEMSRIMLALKTILAEQDPMDVLVFDEIDGNIGDRLGAAIGQKMRALARPRGDGREKQILCITHLSQIAACAERHIQISKEIVGPEKDRQTVAKVRVLQREQRVDELAEMMAGRNTTRAARSHARDLLRRVQPSRFPCATGR